MDSPDGELLSVTVDVWHPDCWVLRTSREADVGLLGHGTNTHAGTSTGSYTLYGPSTDAIDAAVERVRDSPLTESAAVVASPGTSAGANAGAVSRDVVVEFDAGPSIRQAFTNRGFAHRDRTVYEEGRERRSFFVRGDRGRVGRALDEIATAYDADLEVRRVGPARSASDDDRPIDRLSPRQREAFALARRRGYYEYPRGVSAARLADDLGVAKTTFLEHLRKAESKLLRDVDPD